MVVLGGRCWELKSVARPDRSVEAERGGRDIALKGDGCGAKGFGEPERAVSIE